MGLKFNMQYYYICSSTLAMRLCISSFIKRNTKGSIHFCYVPAPRPWGSLCILFFACAFALSQDHVFALSFFPQDQVFALSFFFSQDRVFALSFFRILELLKRETSISQIGPRNKGAPPP